MIEHISAVLIVKNGEPYLKKCLNSLREFKEIVVLENGSTDRTSEIAASFPNVKLFHSEFLGFGPMKELACSYSSNDWIFSIDCDELLSTELSEEIKSLKLKNNQAAELHRLNYFNRHLINGCGWGNDYTVRIFNKMTTGFNTNMVHESVQTSKLNIVRLKGKLHHFSFNNSGELIHKMNIYSELYAKQHRFVNKTTPLQILIKTFFAFFKFYFIKKGFLWGNEGFVISWTNANSVFYKYQRLLEVSYNIPTVLIFDGILNQKNEKELKPILSSNLFHIKKLIVDAENIDSEAKTRISMNYPDLLLITNEKLQYSDFKKELTNYNAEIIIKTEMLNLINKNNLRNIHKKLKRGFYIEFESKNVKRIELSNKNIFEKSKNFLIIRSDL